MKSPSHGQRVIEAVPEHGVVWLEVPEHGVVWRVPEGPRARSGLASPRAQGWSGESPSTSVVWPESPSTSVVWPESSSTVVVLANPEA